MIDKNMETMLYCACCNHLYRWRNW